MFKLVRNHASPFTPTQRNLMKAPLKALSTSALAITAILTAASPAQAELLAYEGFDYAAGAELRGQTGGTGWAAPWGVSNRTIPRIVVQGTGLSYQNLQVTGNSVGNPTTSSEGAERTFLNAPITGSVYFSFLVNGDESTFGRYGALLRPSNNSAGPGAIGQSTANSLDGTDGVNDAGAFSFRENQSELGGVNGSNPGGISITGTNLLVVQYNYDTNQASYWANPTALGGPAPTATVSGIAFADPTLPINEFFFQYRDSASTSAIFDELRVGTTFADVTPVPEPASLVLLGLGGLMLLPRRRNVA